jgi:hypothetical protein
VATEAAWLNGNNLEKEETKKKKEERKKRQNERKDLTLTGLLMVNRPILIRSATKTRAGGYYCFHSNFVGKWKPSSEHRS